MIKTPITPCTCGARSYRLRAESIFQHWAVELTCRACKRTGFSVKPNFNDAVFDAKAVAA